MMAEQHERSAQEWAERCAALEKLLFDVPVLILDPVACRLHGEAEALDYMRMLADWKRKYDALVERQA